MTTAHRWRTVAAGLVVATAVLASACSDTQTTAANSAAVRATGSVTCGSITGGLAFSPPLTATGTSPESATITLKATGCTTSGSNVSDVGSGSTKVTLTSPTSMCSGVLTLRSVALTIDWSTGATPSTVTFSGYSIASTPAGNGGFAFPNPGGRARVAGSFPGGDGGKGSTATITFDPSVAQLLTVCRSSGLASIPVTAGNVTLK